MDNDDRLMKIIQKRMNYNDQDIEAFKNNQDNMNVLSKYTDLKKKQIVARVLAAKGCNSRHRVDEEIFLDGEGNLIPEKNPDRICVHLLGAISPVVNTMHELCFAGIDPNKLRFNRVHCLDVGIECGGWGTVLLEIKMVDISS